jgi:S-adenosylmethionine synthetase
MELIVTDGAGSSPGHGPVEIVERKGIGHPDTICDGIAEHFSACLCRAYLDRFGFILHHNVDKVLLAAGRSRPAFGGGEVVEPIQIILAGRAESEVRGDAVPVAAIAVEAAREWLRANLPALDVDRDVRILPLVRPGSVDLNRLYCRASAGGAPLANDTSCGAGFAPLTPLERAVLAAERALNAAETKRAHPAIGADVKVMGLRRGDRVRLTVSCAFVGRHVVDLADYAAQKGDVEVLVVEAVRDAIGAEPAVVVNAADDISQGDVYLTVTGTSAEAGDDGEVGRGNRANGLITPYRPMTLEAAAGKNPVTHVGKLYGLVAAAIASDLALRWGASADVECRMASCIGRAIDDPDVVDVRVHGVTDRPRAELERTATEVARAHLAGLPALRDRLVNEAMVVY